MKVSMENDNNFGYEKITILVDNIPLNKTWCHFFKYFIMVDWLQNKSYLKIIKGSKAISALFGVMKVCSVGDRIARLWHIFYKTRLNEESL